MKKVYYFLIFFLIFLVYGKVQYIIFFILLIIFFLDAFANRIKIKKPKSVDFIIVGFLLLHIYGIMLGLYLGNSFQYIVNNFAGIFLYLIYFVFIALRLNFNILLKNIHVGIYIYITLILLRFIFNIDFLDNFLAINSGKASSGQDRLFIPMIALFGIFIGTAFFHLEKRSFGKFFTNLLIPIFMFIIVAASKGFALILIFYLIVYLFLNLGKNSGIKIISVTIFISYLLYHLLVFLNYDNVILNIFVSDDISNVIRYSQFNIVLNNLNLFGHGLGATFPNYVRDESAPYSIEMVYLNIFHKYGVFGFIYIIGLVSTFLKLIKEYNKKIERKIVLQLFGLMCYTIASLGNPMLFAPSFIVIHCVVLYYLNYNKYPWFNMENNDQPFYTNQSNIIY